MDNAIVLAHGFWMQRFGGDPGVIGRTVHLDGDPVQIVAVMPRTFDTFGLRSDAYTPLAMDASTWYHRLSFSLYAARLAPGRTIEQANAEYRSLVQNLKTERDYPNPFGQGAALVDMKDALVGDVSSALVLLGGAVVLILLIAAANVGTLQLTRASARSRDAAIRSALGASRGRLLRELTLENGLVAVAGGLFGVLLARTLLPLLVALIPEDTPRIQEVALDPILSVVILAAVVLAGLLVGLVPALGKPRLTISPLLRTGAASASPTARRLRVLLVSAEVALASVLTIGAALMLQTLWRLHSVETGFRPEGVLTLHVQPTGARYRGMSVAEYYDRLLERVRALPGVRAAGAIQHLPFSGYSWVTPLDVEGQKLPAGSAPPSVQMRVVTPGYFTAIGQPLLLGRPIERGDATRDDVVVVNEVLASKSFGSPRAALGRKIRSRGSRGPLPWTTIVGVVGNVRHYGLTAEARPETYVHYLQRPMRARGANLTLEASGEASALAAAVREHVRRRDDRVPMELSSMEALLGRSLAERRFTMAILAVFGAVALALAAIGIYGVVSYSVARRRREMGIRIALGAPPRGVRRLVVRRSMALVATGIAIGVLGALALTRLLETLLYEVSPTDPLTFAAVILLLAATAWLASFIPALRGSRTDPMITMREQ
jgi:putative ABC transport system permease protein